MSTGRDVAIMRRLIREAENMSAGFELTTEAAIEVAVEIAHASGVCPIPTDANGNNEVFDLLSSGWLRFWPPGRPTTLRLDPELLSAFARELEASDAA